MLRCLTVAPHLAVAELEARYRACRTIVERSHWHMLWLIAQGHHVPAVARLTGYSMPWVRTVVHRDNADGPAGIGDRRQSSAGHPPLQSPELRTALADALDGPAPDGGIWTCGKVAAWMAAQLGRPVGAPRGWEAMRTLGFTPQRPRPRHQSRSGRPGGLQKRALQAQVDAIRAAHPTARLTIWAEDEHRLGLLPVIRRVWAWRGHRPTVWVHRRYKWLYVYAFVRPTTGQSWWYLLPTVSTAAMSAALAAFAADEGIDALHRAVLVFDGAGWHTSGKLAVPAGIDFVFLPPASPELQPVKRVWTLVDEPVANRTFADVDEVEDTLVTRCQTLRAARRTIKAHTHYHWWARERRRRMFQ